MEPLRRVPIHRSGIRPHLLLGGDRELVLLTALIAFTLSVGTMNLVSATVGISIWFLALFGLRQMSKADPRMRDVYLRARRYSDYYPARSTPWRVNRWNQSTPFRRRRRP